MNNISISNSISRTSLAAGTPPLTSGQFPIVSAIINGQNLPNQRTLPNSGMLTSLPYQLNPESIFTSIRENTQLQTPGYIHPQLGDELKRISYFELMKAPPSIHQLFSYDFKILVENLVELQKESAALSTTKKAPLINREALIQSEGMFINESALVNSLTKQDIQTTQINDPSQNVAYNHLLYQPGDINRKNNPSSNKTHQSKKQKFTQDKEPYFEKQNKNKNKKYTQKLLKQLISSLQNLSRGLSKYVD